MSKKSFNSNTYIVVSGQKFAFLEMKCLLSAILRRYEIMPIDTREDLKMIADLVLRAANGIRVKFIPRSK